VDRTLVRDELLAIEAAVKQMLADPEIDIIVTNGGTGVAPRDVTIEAVAPLFEKTLPGFGELFRALSFEQVGSAAMLSRADAGIAAKKAIFVLPGSPKACALAMERLIIPECGHVVSLLHR
jgi:molybdenum cofactor biosynthesis protein B